MARKAEILLEFQNYIESPPVAPAQLYGNACSNDGVTIDSWRETWLKNIRANKEKFGSFKAHGVGQLYGQWKYKPAIVAGAGPSLKYNASELLEKKEIPLISCLHNFHFLEDLGVDVDYYVTLDAGPVVIEEVSEGGSKTPDEYWARSKDKSLIAFIGTDPKLFEKWQGKVYFYNAPVPDASYMAELDKIEPFHTYVSNGGNVLGAAMYIAKGIMGANPIAYIGADFSFSYDKKFHAWNSKYDKTLGYVMKAIDIYGNRVFTWQSYANFKSWFDYISIQAPGIWINCTEGGTMGSYPDGNIMAIRQMELKQFIGMYHMHENLKGQCETPENPDKKILF